METSMGGYAVDVCTPLTYYKQTSGRIGRWAADRRDPGVQAAGGIALGRGFVSPAPGRVGPQSRGRRVDPWIRRIAEDPVGEAGRRKARRLRVIYYWYQSRGILLLLGAYAKSELDVLTPTQLRALRRLVEEEFQ